MDTDAEEADKVTFLNLNDEYLPTRPSTPFSPPLISPAEVHAPLCYNGSMDYRRIVKAIFIERDNRFVARVRIHGDAGGNQSTETDNHNKSDDTDCRDEIRVHVKNTGRCKELLVPGATVYLEDHIDAMKPADSSCRSAVINADVASAGSAGRTGRTGRKYRYSLVAVEKKTVSVTSEGQPKSILINMDSQAPNKVVHEALLSGRLKLPEFDTNTVIKPEVTFGTSRFDFFIDSHTEDSNIRDGEPAVLSLSKGSSCAGNGKKAFIEVKGVTLEENGIARFPDAPTQRGVKHIRELENAIAAGFDAYIIFVIQMKGVRSFEPNDETHPEFGEALRRAKATGVRILAYDCMVTEGSLLLDKPVPVRL